MDLKKIIGKNITSRRNELKLTQEELSEASSVAKITISTLERGDSIPKVDTLWKLAQALNTDLNYFITGAEEPLNDQLEPILILAYKSLPIEQKLNLIEYAQYLVKKIAENNATA